MGLRTKWALPLLLLGVVLFFSSRAEAGGLIVYHYGEDVVDLGEITEEYKEAVSAEAGGAVKVGYVHNAFGLFWLDIWTWDGRFCIYRGDQYWEIDAEQAAVFLGEPDVHLGNPIFYTFPPGLLVLIALAALFATYKIISARNNKKLQALFEDPHYQHALKMLSDRSGQATETAGESDAGDGGFEQSVQYLRGQGINEEEARKNLALLVDAIVAYQEQKAAAQG